MRAVINQSVVELRAKKPAEERFTKRETMAIMNYLSIVFDKAAEKFEEEGRKASAMGCRENADNLYEKLDDMGYYD